MEQIPHTTQPITCAAPGTTLTWNGEGAWAPEHFLEDSEKALVAMNYALVAKGDFVNVREYFERVMNGDDAGAKVLALVFLFHVRDIKHGKGLRDPFFAAIKYLLTCDKAHQYKDFVLATVEAIPKYGYYKDLCRLWAECAEIEGAQDLQSAACRVFARQLQHEANNENITNAAKFAPREGKKYAQMIRGITEHLFYEESATPLRDYRKLLAAATKNYKQITEQLMSEKRWQDIDPSLVPSLCFQHNKKHFLNKHNHDDPDRQACKDRFTKHIERAAVGEAKINAKELFVHELIKEMFWGESIDQTMALAREAQMLDILRDVRKSGSALRNCAVMVDVSGSMYNGDSPDDTPPIYPAIALGLVISEVSNTHRVMTFSEHPQWVELAHLNTFAQKVEAIKKSQWATNTDFYLAMQNIVAVAKQTGTMPQALFVLSDMQFDQASGHSDWGTGYTRTVQLFEQNGFKAKDIPPIVFWNLNGGTRNFVVDSDQNGVVTLGGFSQSLLKQIMSLKSIDELKKTSPFKQL